jgi:hypothetical protein
VDLRFYLRQWEGAYRLDWQGGDAAVVRFERAQDLQEALDQLGGGIRGLFRVDRAWRPATAVSAAPARPVAGPSGGRGWGGDVSAQGGGEEAGGSASWTAVAVAPRPAARVEPPVTSAQPAAADQRWAVMTGRRAARPTAPPSSNRNLLAEMVPDHDDVLTTDESSDSD